jgi:4-amino-4-deoxy-L-arabinose transferase-like glycosyltransferase
MTSQIKYFYIVLIVSIVVTFSFYEKITLHGSPPGSLFFNKHIEAHRHGNLEETALKQSSLLVSNPFINPFFSGTFTPFSYESLPGYIFYKVFKLQGEGLWLADKLLTSLLNIGSLLLFFGITRCLFGKKIAVLASILCAFSPHIWVTFNFDPTFLRAYNYFLSILTIYLYLRYEENKKLVYLTGTGVAMGINFLFFHVGSFSIPIIFAIYCLFQSAKERQFKPSLRFIYLFIISSLTVVTLNVSYMTYFKIDRSPLLLFLDWYATRGGIASHSFSGIVFFNINRLSDNIAYFFNSVFINGLDKDWHYTLAPPGIPLIYSYFIFAFSIPGIYFLFKKKGKEKLFLTCWLLFFVLTYSLVIVVKIKNITLLIPPFIILATLGARFTTIYLYRSSHKWLPLSFYFKLILNQKFARKRIDKTLTAILLGGSVLIGGYFITIELPSKNFYGGSSQIKFREIYKHITNKGYSKYSSIVFTNSQVLSYAYLGLRLFTNDVPKVLDLNSQGLSSPYTYDAESNFLKINSKLKSSSDKIYYCFTSYHNHMGYFYVLDNFYEKLFLNIYPDVTPFVIKGLDGKSLWKIYQVAGYQIND